MAMWRGGWLERMAHGVYRRPPPRQANATAETDWQAVLLSLQLILEKDVHLGGLSALETYGHVHYFSLGGPSRVYLYGDVPSWLRRLPLNVQFVIGTRSLFGNATLGIDSTEGIVKLTPW